MPRPASLGASGLDPLLENQVDALRRELLKPALRTRLRLRLWVSYRKRVEALLEDWDKQVIVLTLCSLLDQPAMSDGVHPVDQIAMADSKPRWVSRHHRKLRTLAQIARSLSLFDEVIERAELANQARVIMSSPELLDLLWDLEVVRVTELEATTHISHTGSIYIHTGPAHLGLVEAWRRTWGLHTRLSSSELHVAHRLVLSGLAEEDRLVTISRAALQ